MQSFYNKPVQSKTHIIAGIMSGADSNWKLEQGTPLNFGSFMIQFSATKAAHQ